tara:strand:+ start:120 stop:476 length:357 start_codon:yes stop_codon:yes gene_type:complete
MGKRRRKMNNPKFKTKFSKAIDTYQRLREAASNTITEVTEVVEDVVVEALDKADEFLDKTQEKINALKFVEKPEVEQVEKPKTTRKKTTATKKKAAITKKKTTSTTRKRRTTKTKTDT